MECVDIWKQILKSLIHPDLNTRRQGTKGVIRIIKMGKANNLHKILHVYEEYLNKSLKSTKYNLHRIYALNHLNSSIAILPLTIALNMIPILQSITEEIEDYNLVTHSYLVLDHMFLARNDIPTEKAFQNLNQLLNNHPHNDAKDIPEVLYVIYFQCLLHIFLYLHKV